MTASLGWAAAALLLLGAWASARRRRRALASLESAVSAMAAGDLVVRADGEGVGEFSRLVSGVNMLAVRTAETFTQLGGDKARLRAVLDNMAEGVAIVSSDGRVQDVNAAMERLLGVKSAAARGLTVSEVFRHAPLQDLARLALESRAPQSGEASLFVPEERVFSVSATALPGETRPSGAVLVLHDITRLRRLEELRKEFVANVSHELRTPLASIKSFAETLRLGALDDKEVRLEFVGTIEEQADRLTAIVDDLLELAALEGGRRPLKPEDLDLAAAARKVLAALKPLGDHARVTLSCSVPDGLRARADAGALERVLRNLVENAVKYNRDDGRVEVSAAPEGAAVRVSVGDTGLGIPAADLPRVFERFYRVDKARSREKGGTGLGLSIVKHLVDALGGTVRAESEEGKGSTFSFTLPPV
jgi:two-component system phosphate regulon sensor histidine kinase PhoR